MAIVERDDAFSAHRGVLTDEPYMAAHDALRGKYFLPVRPLLYYLDWFRSQGFDVVSVEHRRIPARVSEWYAFLRVYHEGILGWVGGAEKVTGTPAGQQVIEERQRLMQLALDDLFAGSDAFIASWTYVVCTA